MGAVKQGRSETEPSCNAVVLGTHDGSALRPLVMRLLICAEGLDSVGSVARAG